MYAKRWLAVMLTLMLAWCIVGNGSAQAAYYMPYYIDIDLTNQIVTVYNSSDNSIARQMLCSAGENATTPTGIFYLPPTESPERTEWYYMGGYDCWAHYATHIYLGIYFHSLTYERPEESSLIQEAVEQYGNPSSHGCIRLRTPDVKFIADNCLAGTRVRIYYSDQKNETLRQILYTGSFDGEAGISYKQFLGFADDALIWGSKGEEVSELQLRLRDLGYYDGDIDGNYSPKSIQAVKLLQGDLGITRTGIATTALRQVIFSDAAPVGTYIKLRVGMSGPVVLKLQQALTGLGFYEGELDSIYDAEVVDAVKELQRCCGYDDDGIATAEIQHLVYYELSRIRQELGDDYSCERITEDMHVGTVNLKDKNAVVRSKASTESAQLTQLRPGESAIVLAIKGEWAQLLCEEGKGYMYTDFLTPSVEKNTVLCYTGNGETITLGNTLEEMSNGSARDERAAFLAYVQKADSPDYIYDTVDFAIVNTGSPSVALNLRAQASSDSEVLGKIRDGTKLRVLGREDGFTLVGYDDEIGYLMDDYLNYTEDNASETVDTSHALDASYDPAAEPGVPAIVMPKQENGYVHVYKSASTGSDVVASLRGGRKIRVIQDDEEIGWALINSSSGMGYIQDRYLTYAYYFYERNE